MNNTGLGTVETESEYVISTRNLDQAVEELKENVMRLHRRLEPIMRPDVPMKEPPPTLVPDQPVSSLVLFLREEIGKVKLLNRTIVSTLNDLQV